MLKKEEIEVLAAMAGILPEGESIRKMEVEKIHLDDDVNDVNDVVVPTFLAKPGKNIHSRRRKATAKAKARKKELARAPYVMGGVYEAPSGALHSRRGDSRFYNWSDPWLKYKKEGIKEDCHFMGDTFNISEKKEEFLSITSFEVYERGGETFALVKYSSGKREEYIVSSGNKRFYW